MKKPLHLLAGLAGLLLSALPAAAQGSLNMVVRREHLWDQSGDLNNCPPLKLFHVLSGNGFSFLDTEGPLRWPPVGRFALFEN